MSETKVKRVEKTPEQKRDEIYQRSVELQEKAAEQFKKTNVLYQKVEKEIRDLKKENISFLRALTKRFNDQTAVLKEVSRISQSTEDTHLNVLLAIRQNEFLQAHYPEQHGYPAMKVVGSHPAKTNPLT